MQPRICRRAVALDHQRAADVGRRGLDPPDQLDEVFQFLGGRHENIEQALPDLGHQRGPRHGVVVFDHSAVVCLVCPVCLLRGGRCVAGRQRGPGVDRIGIQSHRWRFPADRVQWQPQPGGRVTLQQHDASAAQLPIGTGPTRPVIAAVQGQYIGGGLGDRLFQVRQQRGAGIEAVGLQVVLAGDRIALGLAHRPGQPAQRILVYGADLAGGQPQPAGDAVEELTAGVRGQCSLVGLFGPRVSQQRVVGPQWFAVGAPVQPDLPTWQRLPRVPLALPALHETLRRPDLLQSRRQGGGPFAFVLAVGVGRPLRVDLVVDRDERGLAAHGEPHVTGVQPLIDAGTERVDLGPSLFGVGQRDTRILVHPSDDIGEFQRGFTRLRRAGDGCRGRGMRGCRQRDVALAGEQTRGGVHADPPGARDVHLGPGV